MRGGTPEFAGNALVPFHTPHRQVVAYQRPGTGGVILVLANVADDEVLIEPVTLSGFDRRATDIVSDATVDLGAGVALPAHGFAWLRVHPR